MPALSTAHSDIPEEMGKGLRHLLAPERNPEALEKTMRVIIESREDWSSAAKGRERTAAEYDLKLQSHRQAGHYARLNKAIESNIPLQQAGFEEHRAKGRRIR